MSQMPRWLDAVIKTKLKRPLTAAALLISSNGVALADTVGFNPSTSSVIPGATFTVDIVGTGFTELAGGVIDLGFDNTHLQINSVSIDPYFDSFPDGGGPAAGNVWPGIAFDTFANAPAVGDFTIATIDLTVLASGPSNPGFSTLDILISSEFFSATAMINPIRTPATVSSVPVPAAAWLFGSGLLGLIGVARKKIP